MMQSKLAAKALFWFGTLMAAVFLSCGLLFLLSDFLIENLPPPNRTYLGYMFIGYSIFRGWRQYSLYRKINDE
jgi:hypothetical protein